MTGPVLAQPSRLQLAGLTGPVPAQSSRYQPDGGEQGTDAVLGEVEGQLGYVSLSANEEEELLLQMIEIPRAVDPSPSRFAEILSSSCFVVLARISTVN